MLKLDCYNRNPFVVIASTGVRMFTATNTLWPAPVNAVAAERFAKPLPQLVNSCPAGLTRTLYCTALWVWVSTKRL